MNKLLLAVILLAGCGDNIHAVDYTAPSGGKLRLVHGTEAVGDDIALDLIVGDAPLTGYSVGFDLPLDATQVTLVGFTPGTALPAGSAPAAAMAQLPTSGPLAGMLVAGQSQKASGAGAVDTDATLQPGDLLFTIRLHRRAGADGGVVFDGTADDFVLPSGGMRDRAGTTVVGPDEVAIGKLELN